MTREQITINRIKRLNEHPGTQFELTELTLRCVSGYTGIPETQDFHALSPENQTEIFNLIFDKII